MNTLNHKAPRTFPIEKLKFLDLCHHIHKQAEELYLALSHQHQEHREIARLWGELAVDKCNHADAFKMAGKLKGAELHEINGTLDAAVRFLEKMKQAVKATKQTPLAVTDALKFTITMEERLEKFHLINVVVFYRAQDRNLRTSSLKKSSEIVQIFTEQYVNMTLLD